MVARAESIPCINGYGDTTFYAVIGKGVDYGDTINSNIEFHNNIVYLTIDFSVIGFGEVWGHWSAKDYFPVCLKSDSLSNCIYGWIKVNCVSGYSSITIDSYAINIPSVNLTDQNLQNHFTIYPNPTTDNIYIDCDKKYKSFALDIYNMQAQRQNVKITKTEKGSIISMKQLPTGIYFIQILTDEGSITRKIVKK